MAGGLDKKNEEISKSLKKIGIKKAARKRGILTYHDDTHIPRVVEEIIENWELQSQNRKFNAILTVAFKERVIAYFEEFKKQLASHKDRKSTRLNSSHVAISYAVFCLKKKTVKDVMVKFS